VLDGVEDNHHNGLTIMTIKHTLAPVKKNRAFQEVIDQIQEAILEGKLKAGERLPSERELGKALATSRGTLREALRVLEQKGLISVKTGVRGGAIVKAVSHTTVSDSLALLIRSRSLALEDLAEFREGIEGIVAGLAAQRATKEDYAGLKDLLGQAEKFQEIGVSRWKEFLSMDNKIHVELARISGNPMYELVLNTVHDNINLYYNRMLPKEPGIMKRNLQDLRKIVQAVESGNSERATLLVQEHVRHFNRLMMEKKK